jgi:hypothetical protein
MKTSLLVTGILLGASLSGCVAFYQPQSYVPFINIRGGYSERNRGHDVWRVTFGSSSPTTPETVQCYWLYRCAEIALDKGFDGFEIVSNIRLVTSKLPEEFLAGGARVQPANWVKIPLEALFANGGFGPKGEGGDPLSIQADILLLKGPIAARPPRVFDARKLKTALAPHVSEPMKSHTNVKPHVHDYLRPDGALTDQSGHL